MAFDGCTIACIKQELNNELCGGRITKIIQPEKDEILITVKNDGKDRLLLMSADPSLPMIYLTDNKKNAPLNAPAFCMLLRKHLSGGRIRKITQPSLERVLDIEVEHYNDMGDICIHTLTVELMGKHSNIILRSENDILDSIRHVSSSMSSVREVLPGRKYFIPFAEDKDNPLQISRSAFCGLMMKPSSLSMAKALYTSLTGLSPVVSEEIAYNAGIDSDRPISSLSRDEAYALFDSLSKITDRLKKESFCPNIVYKNEEPVFYGPFIFNIYKGKKTELYESISRLLFDYYSKRQKYTSMRQKTADLRQILNTLLARDNKKYDLQLKQIKDTKKKDKYKLYGELLTAYGYDVPAGSTKMESIDYNTGEPVTIPLDPTLSAVDNGKRYFEKYAKLKRTFENLSTVIEDTKAEIDHLESVIASLDTVRDEADIAELKKEMIDTGYVKSRGQSNAKKRSKSLRSAPLHYVSSDGHDIYVGKNNYQNEYITFTLADGNDWWFHAKKLPGSHVILKTAGDEPSDKAFEEAASLAAHFSKAEGAAKVEIDYIQRKHIKKPAGAKPGYVIYHKNYSMSAETDISGIQESTS